MNQPGAKDRAISAPPDSAKLTITYDEYRRLARARDLIAEGYSEDVRRAGAEAEVFRTWALELERLVLAVHPAGKGVCPGCGKRRSCPTRRAALLVRREQTQEWAAREADFIRRAAEHSANRLAALDRTKATG